MKAKYNKVRVGSKIKNCLGDILTVKERKDGIVIATWENGRGELWLFGDSQLKDFELVE